MPVVNLKRRQNSSQYFKNLYYFESSRSETTTKLQRDIFGIIRGALFIFWALATLSVLRCNLTFALESLTFLVITTFRTSCNVSVICVVYSDLKIVSQKKNSKVHICTAKHKRVKEIVEHSYRYFHCCWLYWIYYNKVKMPVYQEDTSKDNLHLKTVFFRGPPALLRLSSRRRISISQTSKGSFGEK